MQTYQPAELVGHQPPHCGCVVGIEINLAMGARQQMDRTAAWLREEALAHIGVSTLPHLLQYRLKLVAVIDLLSHAAVLKSIEGPVSRIRQLPWFEWVH